MYVFGTGALIATPQYDASGNALVNPSPVEFGTLQEVGIDVSFDTKQLYGSLQFPVAAGRGKGKVTGKAKAARLNGMLLNSVVFGQTMNFGVVNDVYDTTGAAIPATPYQITPTVPGSGTWTRDLGVKDANGIAYIRVASAPATGQYSVSAGVYTFAAADTGKTVYISYQYTAASTTAPKIDVMNLPMGYAPSFSIDFYMPYQGKQLVITAGNVVSNKLSMATKQDDFMVPEIDFDVYADANNKILTFALTDK
jgi:hypothetical protein